MSKSNWCNVFKKIDFIFSLFKYVIVLKTHSIDLPIVVTIEEMIK